MSKTFNLLILVTKFILHITKPWSCDVMCTICGGGNQDLELQQWEGFKNSKVAIILAIIMFVTCDNHQIYKEHDIYFVVFDFEEIITIIEYFVSYIVK